MQRREYGPKRKKNGTKNELKICGFSRWEIIKPI